MAINLHSFSTPAEFENFRWDFIKRAEGVRTAPYLDSVGVPTIGVGFNLEDESIRNKVFAALRWDINDSRLTPADRLINNNFINNLVSAVNKNYSIGNDSGLRNAVNAVLVQRAQALSGYNFIAKDTSMVLQESQMPSIFLLSVPEYHRRVRLAIRLTASAWPDESREMVALTSMAYQGTLSRISSDVKKAIDDGNRAEVWYLIRYTAQITGNGDYGRHFAEAQTFGLYDGQNTGAKAATPEESKRIYQMLTAHRGTIMSYEASHGAAAVSDTVSRFGLSASDTQFTNSLTPAYTAFINYANSLHGAGAPDIDKAVISNAAAIYFQNIAESTEGNLVSGLLDARVDDALTRNNLNDNLLVGSAVSDTEYGGTGKDYLMGLAGKDHMDGGSGDDTLNGGAGDDTLKGGAGLDAYIYAVGDGKDVITDEDGQGQIVISNCGQLTGASWLNYALIGNAPKWDVNNGENV